VDGNQLVANNTIWWMAIPYGLGGMSVLFVNVPAYGTASARAPHNMRSLRSALNLFNSAIAYAIAPHCCRHYQRALPHQGLRRASSASSLLRSSTGYSATSIRRTTVWHDDTNKTQLSAAISPAESASLDENTGAAVEGVSTEKSKETYES
jgi:hypothetical protein